MTTPTNPTSTPAIPAAPEPERHIIPPPGKPITRHVPSPGADGDTCSDCGQPLDSQVHAFGRARRRRSDAGKPRAPKPKTVAQAAHDVMDPALLLEQIKALTSEYRRLVLAETERRIAADLGADLAGGAK